MGGSPRLSVVVACRHPTPDLALVLQALALACRDLDAEILVVSPRDGAPGPAATAPVRWIPGPAGALVPHLWGVGLAAAAGDVTAFTSAEFRVPPSWARALLDTVASGATGAGGAIALGPGASMLGRAIYFLRYSAFQPPLEGPAAEIPGDNAGYRTDALRRHGGPMTDGFWEVDFHRRLRAEGGSLRFAGDATATFSTAGTLLDRLGERFRHGRYSGSYRVRALGHRWWRGMLATPLVPAVLVARVLGRAARAGRLGPALSALPALVPLAAAWAMGEAAGALAARRPAVAR